MESAVANIESSPSQTTVLGGADCIESSEPLAPGDLATHRRRRDEVLVALGRRAIAAPSWRMLAYDAAALVAESLMADQFAVAELADDRRTLTIRMAQTTDNRQHADLPPQRVENSETTSLAGYALARAQPVAVADFSLEKRFRDVFLEQRGLKSAAAIPLLRGEDAYGALFVASMRRRAFAADELQYFETIAHLVSTTIAHERAREELAQERRFQTAVLESTASLMLILSPNGRILQINRAASTCWQFEIDELRDRTFVESLLVTEEVAMVERALTQVSATSGPFLLETTTVSKGGQRRIIQWSLAGLTDTADRLERIVLTGIDVTRQREIEVELAQVRSADNNGGELKPFSLVPTGPQGDRRQRLRRAFPFVQMIAPMIPGQRPDEHHYRPVRCRDISPTGFSFLSPMPPDFQDLMVVLGVDSSVTYLAARVMHATLFERDGKISYIVGCRYLSRAQDNSE